MPVLERKNYCSNHSRKKIYDIDYEADCSRNEIISTSSKDHNEKNQIALTKDFDFVIKR